MTCAPDDPDFYDDDDGSIGCANCDLGWRHGCCDDLCRGAYDAADCSNARACQTCNPDGAR